MRRALLFIAALLLAGHADAATFSVTNTRDAGAGSLRQAMLDAQAATGTLQVINFSASFPQNGVIALASPLPVWANGMLSIQGSGRDPVIDAGGNHGILIVASGATGLWLRDLSLVNGRNATAGGCVHLVFGTPANLVVNNARFQGCISEDAPANVVSARGGAISWLAASAGSNLSVFIENSLFIGNRVRVTHQQSGFGGALSTSVTTRITSSRFIDNAVHLTQGSSLQLLEGGAIHWRSVASDGQTFELIQSHLENNRIDIDATPTAAAGHGGAVYITCSKRCTANVARSTLLDNAVNGDPGNNHMSGGLMFTSSVASSELNLQNSAFIGNTSPRVAGALRMQGGVLDVRHSAFFDNLAPQAPQVLLHSNTLARWAYSAMGSGVFAAAGTLQPYCQLVGVNLTATAFTGNVFDAACASLSSSGALVGALGDYTLDESALPAMPVPAPDALAVDVIPSDLNHSLPTDARGMPRPQDGNGSTGFLLPDAGPIEIRRLDLFSDGFEGAAP